MDPLISDIRYNFYLASGVEHSFEITLKPGSYEFVPRKKIDPPPEWTKLENCQCSNCPLKKEEHPCCPVAANLSSEIEFFKQSISTEKTTIVVITSHRTYISETDLQKGLGSLIGIIMVTSGCPILDKLRPMVAIHLPFASVEETMYRNVSMYLLAQFMRQRKGLEPAWSLDPLVDIYSEVRVCNLAFTERLRSINVKDASINAIIQLDCFASMTTNFLDEASLKELEELFTSYL
ncbi:MAG: hypothetical protein GY754_43125 [bacterium]|nr:hypothetical protein [bacterium]